MSRVKAYNRGGTRGGILIKLAGNDEARAGVYWIFPDTHGNLFWFLLNKTNSGL